MLKKGAYFIIFLSLSSCIYGRGTGENNLIRTIRVEKNRLSIEVHREFRKKYLKDNFFAEYERDINLERFDYSILSMPLILNVISIVWISGDVYYVDEMDSELYESLARIKEVFRIMYPKTSWNGELRARKLVAHNFVPSHDTKERTALLFSGGIDSTSSVFGHLDKKQLLITAWGHWDLPLYEHALWNARKGKTIEFARQFGNQTAFIKSNYSSFLQWEYLNTITPEIPKWRLGAVEGLGWAGLTAPILLTKGYPVLRIASSHTWLYPYPSAASPYVDNNIFFCGLHVVHDQYELTRVAKIEYIARIIREKNLKKPFLKICSYEKKNDKNCLLCRKCLSTIMGFFAIGEDPRKYGMPISLSLAWERTRKLLEDEELNCYTILYFKGVQQRIQQRMQSGEHVPKELEILAAMDFTRKNEVEAKLQTKIDWNKMGPFLQSNERPKTLDGMQVYT